MKRAVVIILLAFAFLFVLAGIAAVVFFSTGMGGNLFSGRMQFSATAEESKSIKIDPENSVTLKVTDDAGSVTITGADVKTVQIKAIKTAYAVSQSRAEAELQDIKYNITQQDNTVTITYSTPDIITDPPGINVLNANQDTVDFIITVPSDTTADVEAGAGEVNISDINGSAGITNSFGDVTVRNIRGKLTVDTKSGKVDAALIDAGSENIELSSGFGEVSLEKASGKDIRLDSNSGILKVTNVNASGDVEMSTDFGDTRFDSGSANRLHVDTNSGKVTLSALDLSGDLTAKSDFGEISIEKVKATSYDLQTNSGSITADGVLGKVKAHSGYGSVTVKNATGVSLDLSTQSGSVVFEGSLGGGPHTVHSDFGAINLTLPADSALNVDLTTNFGTIKSDIPITVILSGDIKKDHQTGTMNDGGDQLTVETDRGNISIEASQ